MPELLTLLAANEAKMSGLFSDIKLSLKRGACDLSRISSAAGMPMLFDHAGDLPAGRIRDARIRDRSLYATAEVIQTPRNRDHLTELRAGLRPGLSPGFLINDAVLEEDQDGEYCLVVTSWTPYEISSTPIPRNPAAAVLGIDGGQDKDDEDDDEDARADDNEDDDDNKHSMPDTAALAASAVRAVESVLSERREINKALLQTYAASTRTNTTRGRSTMKHEDTGLADTDNVALLKAAMTGGEDIPSEALVGGRPGAKSTIRLAFTSASKGIIGTDADADRLEVREQVTSVRRILGLPRLIEMVEYDQRCPEWTARPIAVTVPESPTRADSAGTIAAAKREPKMVMAGADITLQANIQAPGFEASVLAALEEALEQRIAEELLSGSISTSPNSVDGLIHHTGISETEYAVTAVGAVGGYWDTEDALPTRLSADRRAWIVEEGLYRTTRKTLIEPGANRRVIQSGLLADDAQVIRSALIPDGHAIYAEWSDIVLYRWAEVGLTVDMITKPGKVLLTAWTWWNWSTERADAISILKPA